MHNNLMRVRKILNIITQKVDLEAIFWLAGIVLLAFSNPYSETHYTFFLPAIIFDIQSPGYNLGHSISHLFHGNILLSVDTHPLGIITVFILVSRSLLLLNKSLTNTMSKGINNG